MTGQGTLAGQRRLNRAAFVLTAAALFGFWLVLYLPLLPNASQTLGHDYAYFLPRLLAGYYWLMENGLSALPYFTPAFCGGVMFYTNPQGMFFSLPQMLTLLFDPLQAVQLTFVLFALLGYAGSYVLCRRGFAVKRRVALLAAALFLFNGFYSYRMIIGHLAFHGFMLLPWIAYGLLFRINQPTVRYRFSGSVLAALCSAYIVYSGGAVMLLPLAFAIALVLLIHALWRDTGMELVWRMLLTLLLTLLLSASKLFAVLMTLTSLSRSAYPLPGIDSVGGSLVMAFKSVFVSARFSGQEFSNMMWWLGRHEFEYGVTLAPLLAVLFWLAASLLAPPRVRTPTVKQLLLWLALVLILALPVALNVYDPDWQRWIKSIPVLSSSSSMVRWYMLYIPAAILLAAAAMQALMTRPGRARHLAPVLLALLFASLLADELLEDRQYYAQQHYDPQPVLAAYRALRQNGELPAVSQVQHSTQGDVVFARGISRRNCYEPLFGYRHEFFPQKQALQEGAVTQTVTAGLNMKNPACYTYPAANACAPGDHFARSQSPALEAFRHYRPFEFVLPWQQRLANTVSLLTLLLGVLVMAACGVRQFAARR